MNQEALIKQTREMNKVPVKPPEGTEVMLSTGGQNALILIKKMVGVFCPRYASGVQVLYIDNTDHIYRSRQEALMESIGIEIPERGKAPDLIVWMESRQWLFLMEACSTYDPIDVIRKRELLELFVPQRCKNVFASRFPDRSVMRQYLTDVSIFWHSPTARWCLRF